MNISAKLKQSDLARSWAWLLPAAYALHVVEEAFGGHGLIEWMAAGGGVQLSMGAFLGVNLVGVLVLSLAAWAVRRWRFWQWPLVGGATVLLANGIWHNVLCLTTRSYVPGVLTGLFLYLPVGGFLLHRLRRTTSPWVLISAIAFGLVVHRVTLWLVLGMPVFEM